jgi:hypothetical protein
MIEYCCLAIILVIIIFFFLTILPRKYTYKNNRYSQKNHKNADGRICIKCGNVSPINSKFCNKCGNEF